MNDFPDSSEVKIAKISARQAIVVALIGAVASIATILLKDMLSPRASRAEVTQVKASIKPAAENLLEERLKATNGNLILEYLPLGTIVPSCLTFEQLCIELGQPRPSSWNSANIQQYTWVPADGRIISGSKYDKYGSSVIDLRGVFIRGRNSFDIQERTRVSNEQRDPDGLRDFTNLQKDAFEDHSHEYDRPDHPPSDNKARAAYVGETAGDGPYVLSSKDQTGTANKHKNILETRPKNKPVNFYIKIN